MQMLKFSAWATVALMSLTGSLAHAAAEDVAGRPIERGLHLQRPVTDKAVDLVWLDEMLLWIIGAIVLFVTILLVYVTVKFNRKANPEPARFTHNAVLEVVWTGVPVLILVVIAIPSLRLLDKQLTIPESEVTIKATGNQWYWDYEYPDEGVTMSAFMIGAGSSHATPEVRAELVAAGYEETDYTLATDTRVIVPVDTNVHMLVTAADVIHAWTIPSFGVKIDAVPGRVNETWFNATETGVFFGQCSELCGFSHSYMPIVVEVVSKEDYATWIAEQVARRDGTATDLAQAPAPVAAD